MKKLLACLIFFCLFASVQGQEIPELFANRWLTTMHTPPDEAGDFSQVAIDLVFSDEIVIIKVAVYSYENSKLVQEDIQKRYSPYTIEGNVISVDETFSFTWEDGRLKWEIGENIYWFEPCEFEQEMKGAA